MNINLTMAICALCGYLLGSIPFGLLLTKMAGLGDIRKIGSGNIGATNVLRTGRKDLALLTILLDASKSGFAALLAYHLVGTHAMSFLNIITNENVVASLIAGSCGVIGHNFPIFLKFKGGKGVASTFGFILFINPYLALSALAIWIVMAFASRYSSLSALVAACFVPILSFFFEPMIYTYFYSAIAVLVIIRHHQNIVRLIKGQENKIKLKK